MFGLVLRSLSTPSHLTHFVSPSCRNILFFACSDVFFFFWRNVFARQEEDPAWWRCIGVQEKGGASSGSGWLLVPRSTPSLPPTSIRSPSWPQRVGLFVRRKTSLRADLYSHIPENKRCPFGGSVLIIGPPHALFLQRVFFWLPAINVFCSFSFP